MRSNPYVECPHCETNSLEVIGSDITEHNVGLRRYRCEECRRTFLFVEALFIDDEGNEDAFLQVAANLRLRDREARERRTGHKPRRQLKATDHLRVERADGRLTVSYMRSPRKKAVYLICKRGHALEGANVRINSVTGNRFCVACARVHKSEWWHRHKSRTKRVA